MERGAHSRSCWIHRPEKAERKREWVPISEALIRCQAWATEKNTKIDLYMGFQQCKVFKRYLQSIGKGEIGGEGGRVGVGTNNGIAAQ
jgi:hypothetical protein